MRCVYIMAFPKCRRTVSKAIVLKFLTVRQPSSHEWDPACCEGRRACRTSLASRRAGGLERPSRGTKRRSFRPAVVRAELPIKAEEAEAEPRQQDGEAAAAIKSEREAPSSYESLAAPSTTNVIPFREQSLLPIKKEGTDNDSRHGIGRAATALKREREAPQNNQVMDALSSAKPNILQSVRRSPRKAREVAQQSALLECLLQCPVCSKTLPASIIEINRHIGT